MRPEAVLCPRCHFILLTEAATRQHVKIATSAERHITVHEVDCPKCGTQYGLIVLAEKRKYLIVLVGPERLKDELTEISQQVQGGQKITELWQMLNKTAAKAVLGKRGTCHHQWKFRYLHPLGYIQLLCPRCGAQREETLNPLNLVRFVLKPYADGDKLVKRQQEVIANAVLPRKQAILAEAARELDRQLKINERRRRKLKELRRFCNTAAVVT